MAGTRKTRVPMVEQIRLIVNGRIRVPFYSLQVMP